MSWKDYSRYFTKLIAEQSEGMSCDILLIMVLLGIIAVNLFCLVYSRITGQQINKQRKRTVIWLVVYICIMYQLTFFNRETGSRSGISFELNWGRVDGDYISIRQVIYNVLNVFLFVPLGWLYGCLKKNAALGNRLLMCTLYAFLTSFVIECIQLATQKGYFELTDIVTNTAGGFIGVVLVSVFIAVRRGIAGRGDFDEKGKEA